MGIVALAEGDPRRAALLVAELSGDADTIGSIACAVCGAWSGVEAIPAEWVTTLQRANPEYDFDDIANALYARRVGD
jgi:ADP-ribosylglycohydrolase